METLMCSASVSELGVMVGDLGSPQWKILDGHACPAFDLVLYLQIDSQMISISPSLFASICNFLTHWRVWSRLPLATNSDFCFLILRAGCRSLRLWSARRG